jgi:hypothetical protein
LSEFLKIYFSAKKAFVDVGQIGGKFWLMKFFFNIDNAISFDLIFTVGLGEILEKMKICPGMLANIYLVVKFNFKNILQNNFFDPRPFWTLNMSENRKDF